MTDHAELKRLAEALLASDDHADFPGWMAASDAFDNATGPAAVMALIAENERIQEAHEQICTNYNQVSYASEERGKQIDQLKAELEHTGYDHDLLRNERDQLKAENVVLRSALAALLDLYDTDEGCRNLPQYIAGRAAMSKGKQS